MERWTHAGRHVAHGATELPFEAPARPLRAVPRARGRRGRGSQRPVHARCTRRSSTATSRVRSDSLDDASRALQNESVVSSWYVASDRPRRRPTSSTDARARDRRRGRARSAPPSRPSPTAALSPDRARRARRRPTAASTDPDDARAGRRTAAPTPPHPRVLPRDRRPPARLRRARRARPRQRRRVGQPGVACSRSSGRNTSSRVRRASMIAVLAGGTPNDFSELGRRPSPRRRATEQQFVNTATDERARGVTRRGDGDRPAGRSAHGSRRRFPTAPHDARPSTTPSYQQQAGAARHGDRRRRGRRSTPRANAQAAAALAATSGSTAALRGVRDAPHARCSSGSCPVAIVAPAAPAHRRRARDVAAPAARSWSSRCAPAATSSAVEPIAHRGAVGGRDRRARAGVQRRRGRDHARSRRSSRGCCARAWATCS